jgi:polyferredoxin
VDACDSVMAKLDRPRGLIDYEAWTNIERGHLKEAPQRHVIRPKTIGLALSIVALTGVMGVSLSMRGDAKLTVIHDRNPVAVTLSDGRTRNGYTIRLYNKSDEERAFKIGMTGLPEATLDVVEKDSVVQVAPDATREIRILVSADASGRYPLTFRATDVATGKSISAEDMFMSSEGGR